MIEIIFIVFLILNAIGVTSITWPVFVWVALAYLALMVLSMIQPGGKRKVRR